MQTSVRSPRRALSKMGVRAGFVEGINCPASRTSTHLLHSPGCASHTETTDTLQAAFCRTTTSVCTVQKNKPILCRWSWSSVSPITFIREMTAYRYPLQLKRDHATAASASHVDRNLFKLLLLGQESKIRKETGKNQFLPIETFVCHFGA